MKSLNRIKAFAPFVFLFTLIFMVVPFHFYPGYLVSPVLGMPNEIYTFESMWPFLPQPWYFSGPSGIAIDAQGFVYIADTENNRIQKFTSGGAFVTKWGSQGSGDGEFFMPFGIAVNNSGFVYVTDSYNHRIQKFTSDGEFVTKWGSEGGGDGQFYQPYGIAVDSSGFVYVADRYNHRIQKFNPEGGFLKKWGSRGSGDGQFYSPYGIAVDSSRFVYVADSWNNRIQKFTSDGAFITKWGSEGGGDGQFYEPFGIAVDNNGFIYVADYGNHRIQKFSLEGVFVNTWGNRGSGDGQFDSPYGIAVDSGGFVYVADSWNDRIQKFSLEGGFVATWGNRGSGDGKFDAPYGIAMDSNGFVYVTDSLNDRIQKFTSEGEFVTKWGSWGSGDGQFYEPFGITVDSSGFVYVADSLNDRIQKFTSEGEFVTKWGSWGSGDGQFDAPCGIAVDNSGFVYVADHYNCRIQKFTTEGVFITKWGSWGSGDGQFRYPYGLGVNSSGFVYVADSWNDCIQKFTLEGVFVTKWGNSGNGDGEFDVPCGIAVDDSGFVYVADTDNHRVQKFDNEGGFVIQFSNSGSGPVELIKPSGIALDPNGRVYVTDTSYNNIQVFTSHIPERIQKAIICAGGVPYPGNGLRGATQTLANFAYSTLTNHGFQREGIYYLTTDTALSSDTNVALDIDGAPSLNTLEYAITEWAADPHTLPIWATVQNAVVDDVLIYLIGQGGEYCFRLNGMEVLSASDLDQWLFTLQEQISGSLILIIDSYQSGSFIYGLTPYPEGQRVIITSTPPGEGVIFASNGSLSFSSFFWTSILTGSTLKEAFDKAREAMEYVPYAQHPLLDDNGNYQANDPNDGLLADTITIGTQILWDSNAPLIGSAEVTPDTLVSNSAFILAEGVVDSDRVDRVWAIITPPGYDQTMPNRSITKLPEVTLMPYESGESLYYQGIYNKFNSTGQYTISLYAMDEKWNKSLPKPIYFTYTDYNEPLKPRAIILAGDTLGALSPAITHNLSLTFYALTFQGYDENDLLFLCPSTLSPHSTAPPNLQGLEYAFNTWADQGTKELLLYLTGEGSPAGLKLNSTEILTASQLDAWLDAFQSSTNAIVTLLYDAASSGSFLPSLTPPAGGKRILIASSSAEQPAHFLLDGTLSFSSFFWRSIINGENPEDAFLYASNALDYTSRTQSPMLDDNGDGQGYNIGSDGILARDQTIGYGFAVADDAPIIGQIMPELYLDEETSALIWVDKVSSTGVIASVWCIITPPDYNPTGTVTDLPGIELINKGDGRYEGIYTMFSTRGPYAITMYAMDTNQNLSPPKETRVYQLDNDDTSEQANVIFLCESTPQSHIFNRHGDQDWIKFYGIKDETYQILIQHDNDTNAWVPLFELYTSDGITLVEPPFGWPLEKSLTWQCPQTGVYYLKIWNSDLAIYGEGTGYNLSIFLTYIPDGIITGIIRDAQSGQPIKDALISTSIEGIQGGGSAISDSDGSYKIPQRSGYCTIQVEKAGYHTYNYPGLYVKKIGIGSGDELAFTRKDVALNLSCPQQIFPGRTLLSPPPCARDLTSYELLLHLGSPDEVSSIHRGPGLGTNVSRVESTYYFFGKPSGAKFPIRKTETYMIHMKKEKVFDYNDLLQ